MIDQRDYTAERFLGTISRLFPGVNPAFTPNRRKRRRRMVETKAFARMLSRLLRAHGRRVAEGDVDDLADLLALGHQVDAIAREAVGRLRGEQGYSWADIGRAAGTTRQAAFQRWGDAS